MKREPIKANEKALIRNRPNVGGNEGEDAGNYTQSICVRRSAE